MKTSDRPKAFIVGVGMTPFTKPSKTGPDYVNLVGTAVTEALDDADIDYRDVQQAACGYFYGESCCAQRALYQFGFTGIPILNVNNGCASGSSAVFTCKQIIESGNADVALAVGFEQMESGSIVIDDQSDRKHPLAPHVNVVRETFGLNKDVAYTAQFFVNAALEHMQKYGTTREHFAKIAHKNHLHSVENPKSQYRTKYTLEQVLNSKKIFNFLTLLECSPTSNGAAAVIVVSERFLQNHPRLWPQAVEIVGIELGSDEPGAFTSKSCLKMVGYDMMKSIAERLYRKTGLTAHDAQVIELHDCFSPNELFSYETLGLCPIGKGGEIVDRGDNTYGGKWVINPSGGLISKGHPIGATGVAQAVELSNQLRGRCGPRQVSDCRLALQHNIGLGGAGFVAFYRKAIRGDTIQRSIRAVVPMKSDAFFNELHERLSHENEATLANVDAAFRFQIWTNEAPAKPWLVDFTARPPRVDVNDEATVDTEFALHEDDFMKIVNCELRPEQAFMQGKMTARGDMNKALKMHAVFALSPTKAHL